MVRDVFRVRLEPLPASELMPARARVTDLDTGHELGGRIPIEYAAEILAAVVGQAVEVDLYDDPPVYDPTTDSVRREPAVLLIVRRWQ